MFTLLALLKDHAANFTNASLMHDLQALPGIQDFRVFTRDLQLSRTTIVVMEKQAWRVRFFIRPGEDMTLSTSEVKKALGKKRGQTAC